MKNILAVDSIHKRIELLVDKFGNGKNTVFASLIDSNEGNIRGYIKGTVPKQDILEKIVRNIDINPDWLLTGRGEMLQRQDDAPIAIATNNPSEGIPLIPFDAMAGICNGDISVMELDCEHYVVPAFKGADFLIPVKGSSMYPKYSSGDIVACKKIPLKDLFFQWNKVYVLDTIQGPLIKRIAKGNDKNHILAVSENPKYEPFELHLSQLRAVSIVMGVIRLE